MPDAINTLLLTGRNNHDWKRSSAFCAEMLEKSGRFKMTVTEDPSAALEGATGLTHYGLFFVDYNGPAWSDKAKHNFAQAVHAGTGVVILHASNNAFKDWPEYAHILGLAWRDTAGHGYYHQFEVVIRDPEHPITRGVSNFRQYDELYHGLTPTPGIDCHVLATAFSSPDEKGSGRDEPMMITLQYGRGRVFHQILGHVWPGEPAPPSRDNPGTGMHSFENPPFKKLTLRGAEWAATGAVTL